jgi:hypothetical protein
MRLYGRQYFGEQRSEKVLGLTAKVSKDFHPTLHPYQVSERVDSSFNIPGV